MLGPVAVDSVAVPLNPRDPSATTLGAFHYAGGVQLTSRQTNQLHELSDLVVTDDGRLTAIGDEGLLLDARLVLDAEGRLAGVTGVVLSRLTGEDGNDCGAMRLHAVASRMLVHGTTGCGGLQRSAPTGGAA